MGKHCEFVDPSSNILCGSPNQITKIVFNSVSIKIPMVFYACKRHGDMRFNALSLSEIELTKLRDRDSVNWSEFKDEIQKIRWKFCRRCNSSIGDQVTYCVEYFWIQKEKLGLRRSFILHNQCAMSELKLYGVGKKIKLNQTLDGVIKSQK